MDEANEILTSVITKLAEDAARSLAEKAKEYLVDREKKEQIDTKQAYETYLKKVLDIYSKSKTVLYRGEPKKLSSFFVPLTLEKSDVRMEEIIPVDYQRSSDKLFAPKMYLRKKTSKFKPIRVETCDLNNVLQQGNMIIITGIGGMGKTMLMKYFCTNAIENGYKIPVYISLGQLNNVNIDREPFEKLIHEQLRKLGFDLDYKYFEYSLKEDIYLFLFDGLDEISREKRKTLSPKISEFANQFSKNSFILSSRPTEEVSRWENFTVFSICPLSRKQTTQLIRKLEYDDETKNRFINELKDEIYAKYRSFVSVPILLSILFLTYSAHTVLPETLNEFYENAFTTLLYEHDRMKMGFDRVFTSGLSYEAFREVFLLFCFITFFEEKYSFSNRYLVDKMSLISQIINKDFDKNKYICDLEEISCMLIRDGQEYTFLHRSFQEYFTAVLMEKKSDEKQMELCSRYIKEGRYSSHSLDLIIALLSDNGFRYSYNDFLVLLQSVEPERFEKIVLIPILQKVYEDYERNNSNLFATTMRWSKRLRDYMKKYITYDNAGLIFEKTGEFSEEYKVLERFYKTELDKLGKGIYQNDNLVKQLKSESIELNLNNTVDDDSYTIIYNEMYFIAAVIARYEEVCMNVETIEKSFNEVLYDFLK